MCVRKKTVCQEHINKYMHMHICILICIHNMHKGCRCANVQVPYLRICISTYSHPVVPDVDFSPKFLSAQVTTRKYEHDHPRNPGFLHACPAHSKSNSDVKIICLPSSSKFPKNITPRSMFHCVWKCSDEIQQISNGFSI